MTKGKFLKIAIRSTLVFIKALSKKRHWYQINVYFHKGDRLISKRTTQIGMLFRRDILNRRSVAKTIGEGYYKERSLHGSTMGYQVVAYIGKLKTEDKKNV